VSRVSRAGFADNLSSNMENLDWLATAGVRHQRVVSELARRGAILPARFGTIFHTLESLERDISGRKRALIRSLARVADTDEWGIKVFLELRPQPSPGAQAASGSDYLRRKASVLRDRVQHHRNSRKLSPEIQQLASALDLNPVAAGTAKTVQLHIGALFTSLAGQAPYRVYRPLAALFIREVVRIGSVHSKLETSLLLWSAQPARASVWNRAWAEKSSCH